MKTRLTLALSATVLLVACDRTPAPQADAESYNDSGSMADAAPVAEPESAELPADQPVAPPPATVAVETPPPADPVSVDDQMIEDAEATGMTARVARDDGADGDAASGNAPAADVRE